MTRAQKSEWSIRRHSFLDEFNRMLIDVVGEEHPETLEGAIRLVRLNGVKRDECMMDWVLRLEGIFPQIEFFRQELCP